MKKGILALFIALSSLAFGQVPTHIITLGGDSILYSNSQFRFTEFIDARTDTTKLGLLKENYNSSNHQIINFPKSATEYLPSFLNTVVHYAANCQNICVVIKELTVSEEPLGAIEMAKTGVKIHFYVIKEGQYKLIKKTNASFEKPSAEVSNILGQQMERTIRVAFHDFLVNPSSEGENRKWITKPELIKAEIPKNRVSIAPTGKLEYSGLHFTLNTKTISRKKAIEILRLANDNEINTLIDKNRKNFWASFGFSVIAGSFVSYPIIDFAVNQNEFKSTYIMFGTGSTIVALLLAKAYRDNMREAVDLYNERYNE
ncbi:MAG: hypothetical protein ACPGLV_02635 [Bacteroidia bacterium]